MEEALTVAISLLNRNTRLRDTAARSAAGLATSIEREEDPTSQYQTRSTARLERAVLLWAVHYYFEAARARRE